MSHRLNLSRSVLVAAFLGACAVSAGCQDPVGPSATLATDEHGVRDIAVADDYVYWATSISGMLKRIRVDSGTVEILVDEKQQLPDNLSLGPDYLYWTTGNNLIMRVLREGGEPEIVLFTASELTGLAVDTMHVYWATANGDLQRLAIENIEPLQATDDEPTTEAVATGLTKPRELAVSGSIFCLDQVDSVGVRVLEIDAPGSVPSVVDTESSGPTRLAVSNDNLFWSSSAEGFVNFKRRGSSVVTKLDSGHERIAELVADEETVFWTSYDGTLSVAAIAGGEPQDVVLGPDGIVVLALDTTRVYWANSATNQIRTMPKGIATGSTTGTP